jgi:IclR family acetate operon transcriptional repressor
MRAVQVTLRILETLGRIQPAGVSEVARAVDLPKSTAQRVLKALAAEGWIEPMFGERGAWTLSLTALIALGRGDYATRHLRMAAVPVMDQLRHTSKESVFLAAKHGHQIALVERFDGINPGVRVWPLWRAGPMHTTSLGKAILAQLPPDQLEDYLRQPLTRVTAQTENDPDALRAELAIARKQGFATTSRTNWGDHNGVGAAIRDQRGQLIGAISISAPADRVSLADCIALAPAVIDAARRIGMGLAPH